MKGSLGSDIKLHCLLWLVIFFFSLDVIKCSILVGFTLCFFIFVLLAESFSCSCQLLAFSFIEIVV